MIFKHLKVNCQNLSVAVIKIERTWKILVKMLIKLITISKFSSDVVGNFSLEVPCPRFCQYRDILLAIYKIYPRLSEEDFNLFYLVSKDMYVKVKDYLSYVTALIAVIDNTIILLLDDCPDDWHDNIEYILYLDRKEEEERKERDRDIYDVKIERPGEEVVREDSDVIFAKVVEPRRDEEILSYAINKRYPYIRCYLKDDLENEVTIGNVKKGMYCFYLLYKYYGKCTLHMYIDR